MKTNADHSHYSLMLLLGFLAQCRFKTCHQVMLIRSNQWQSLQPPVVLMFQLMDVSMKSTSHTSPAWQLTSERLIEPRQADYFCSGNTRAPRPSHVSSFPPSPLVSFQTNLISYPPPPPPRRVYQLEALVKLQTLSLLLSRTVWLLVKLFFCKQQLFETNFFQSESEMMLCFTSSPWQPELPADGCLIISSFISLPFTHSGGFIKTSQQVTEKGRSHHSNCSFLKKIEEFDDLDPGLQNDGTSDDNKPDQWLHCSFDGFLNPQNSAQMKFEPGRKRSCTLV